MTRLRVVVGCYDGTIHGWEQTTTNSNKTPTTRKTFDLVFAYTAHRSCVKTMTILSGHKRNIMVSGGTDELLRVYDLRKRKEVGELSNHQAAVECVEAAGSDSGHILSGSKDGMLCVWRTAEWECVHELKGHKPGQVTGIAVHPAGSGRVAFSTCRDNSLRMWDLSTGKPASRIRIPDIRELTVPRWSSTGNHYAVVGDGKAVFVYDVEKEDGSPVTCIKLETRVNDMRFVEDKLIALGCEDGTLRVYDFSGKERNRLDVSEKSRIKALHYVKPYVVTATSSGDIHVWNAEKEWDLVADMHAATDANLTCLAVAEIGETSPSQTETPILGKRSKNKTSSSGEKRGKQSR